MALSPNFAQVLGQAVGQALPRQRESIVMKPTEFWGKSDEDAQEWI